MRTTRRFGVEVEVKGMAGTRAVSLLRDAGVAVIDNSTRHWTPDVEGSWKVEADGSLGNPAVACEVISPPLTSTAEVVRVLGILERGGATVDRACGLHVHVDARDLDLASFQSLAVAWVAHQSEVERLVQADRRGGMNHYCRPWVPVSAEAIRATRDVRELSDLCVRNDRYHNLNLTSFFRHRTVEFRQHGGTVNGRKAEAWVIACVGFVAAAVAGRLPVVNSTLAEVLPVAVAAANDGAETSVGATGRARRDPPAGSVSARIWSEARAAIASGATGRRLLAEVRAALPEVSAHTVAVVVRRFRLANVASPAVAIVDATVESTVAFLNERARTLASRAARAI